jgi:E3 ubiquitin-protein ligase SspH2
MWKRCQRDLLQAEPLGDPGRDAPSIDFSSMPITSTESHLLAKPTQVLYECPRSSSSRQVDEAKRLVLEYVGQRDEPGHERRCTALLAALAWIRRQFSQTGGADIESVCRDLTRHLARSCREGVDAEALIDALASLGADNMHSGPSLDPSPAHVQFARDVLTMLGSEADAGQLLGELIGSMPERHEGQGSGVDELYRSALCAWVAVAPTGDEGRAIAKDRILDMADGKLDMCELGLYSLPELPAGLATLDARCNRLTELPPLPPGLTELLVSVNHLTHLPTLPTSLTALGVDFNRLSELPALPAGLITLDASANRLTHLLALPTRLATLDVSDNQLTQLPELPVSLTALWVHRNQLPRLPVLPASLTMLDVSDNPLSCLPPGVLRMPHDGQVLIYDSQLSPDDLQQLRAATSESGYNGPRFYFSKTVRGRPHEDATTRGL